VSFPFSRSACAAVVATLLLLAPALARAQGVDYRLGIGHNTGNSVGLDDGFTRFESWLPIARPSGDSILFADLRMLLFNDQMEADGANIGLGGRWHDTLANRIWGAYLYYDYRDTGRSHFNQISWGIENLGPTWDWRVNAHLPIGDTWYDFLTPETNTEFIGQNLFFTGISQEVALRGLQAEVAEVLADGESWQLRGAVGMYGYWHDEAGISAVGPRGRMELRVADQLWLSGYLQHDDEFQTTGGLTLVWRYGLRKHFVGGSSSDDLSHRLGDPIERIQQVAIKRHSTGVGSVQVVRNEQGEAFTFRHVRSSASGGGDGSIEAPSNSLAAASNQPEDIVLVHGGSEFVGELFVTTTEGQRVLGEGVEHTIVSQQLGPILLPTVNAGPAPVIREAPGNAIIIAANGVEVSGFEVVDPLVLSADGLLGFNSRFITPINGIYISWCDCARLVPRANGIVADNVRDINVNRNQVSGATGSGIQVRSLGGYNRITDNVANQNRSNGLEIQDDFSGSIRGNTAIENGLTGVVADGDVTGDISSNSTSRNAQGVSVWGTLRGNLIDNLAIDNRSEGIVIGVRKRWNLDELPTTVTGSVVGNVTDGSARTGLSIIGRVAGDVAQNQANGNRRTGINIQGDVGGSVFENTTNETRGFPFWRLSGEGMVIRGNVAGQLRGNIANDNRNDGIFIEGDVHGQTMENVVNRNGQRGLVARNFFSDVTNNTARGNRTVGLQATEAILGSQSGNELTENGSPVLLGQGEPVRYGGYGFLKRITFMID